MSAARKANSRDCVVVGMARTPFGRFGGALRMHSTVELGVLAIDETLRRSAVTPGDVDALYAGVAMIGGGVLTPARQMVLRSSLPETTPSLTIDRACCSGMTAIGLALRDIASGHSELVIAGGAESLSSTPRLLPRSFDGHPGKVEAADPLTLRTPFIDGSIATYTGEEALRHGIDRMAQDAWALSSHQRALAAEAVGVFEAERITVEASGAAFTRDESPRADTSLEKLASLKTVYGSPTVTAGNAPGLNDGAAFVLLASRELAERNALSVIATIHAHAQVAGGPTSGTTTPAEAIFRSLAKAGCDLSALDLIEINEAYAATPLVSTLRLAGGEARKADALRQITNVHGGAVALGHPMGASGARLVITLANALTRRGGGRGIAAICGGFGQGDAMIVEVG